MEKDKLTNFVIKFFENLKANLSWDDKILVIKNVPESFEKSYGKKAPYYLVFEEKNKTENTELVISGRGILNHITQYLGTTGGNTTLLKMNFNMDPANLIKKEFEFINSNITGLKQSYKNNFFYRFTFQTTFTYLNQQEQLLNEIYVHNNEIVEGDLAGYPVSEGKKEDISAKDIETNYEIAKLKIKTLIANKTKEIGQELNDELTAEIKRVQEHYKTQKSEINNKVTSEIEKLSILKNQNTNSEIEKQELNRRIKKIESTVEKIKEENNLFKIEKEEEFTINDLRQKHSLNITNKLINTTIIYYPIFTFNLSFDNTFKKSLPLIYNPLTDNFDPVICSHCEQPIIKIEMCSSGHVVCPECAVVCKDCGQSYCKNCLKYSCEHCKKRLCKNCAIKCSFCNKIFCKEHSKQDQTTNEKGCVNCFKVCPKCKNSSNPKSFKKVGNVLICQKCANKEISKKITKELYEKNM